MKSSCQRMAWPGERQTGTASAGPGSRWRGFAALAGGALAVLAASNSPDAGPPDSPRTIFNCGTQKLQEVEKLRADKKPVENKFREAEAFLQTVLASQTDRFQPPALFNLGHVRFGQGVEELKKGPQSAPTIARGDAARIAADEATRAAVAALSDNDLQEMVTAYLRGRAVRSELKAAEKAVRRAIETHSAARMKWERSWGDFESTVELRPADLEAKDNADIVDKHLKRLKQSMREMEMLATALGDKKQDLAEKLKQLKGRIPAPDMPPGAAGDEDEEEDKPNGPKEGDKEGPSKDGREETSLSPEQAGWLLDGFRLDSERRLPMGVKDTAEPRDRNRPTW